MMSEFGVVAFDNVDIHESGWAFDGNEYLRISSTSELDSDVTWICNLDYNEMFETGLNSNARFRRMNYLSENFYKPVYENSIIRPYDIGKQFGLEEDDIKNRVILMQSFYENVMKVIKKFHGISHAYSEDLPTAMRRMYDFDPIVNEGLFMALEQSDVPYVSTERNFMKFEGYEFHTWHEPRIIHSQNILNNYFPKQNFGEWERRKIKITDIEKSLEFIDQISEEGLALYRVKLKDFDDEINRITNFGSGKNLRFWVTDVELKFLSNHVGTIEISDCFICPNISKPNKSLDILFNKLGYIHNLSYSLGIYAQNLWLSYTKPKRPSVRFLAGKSVYNVMSPFINSYDRIILQEKAIMLSNLGAIIIGYGRGKIQFAIDKNMLYDIDWINKAINQTGLIPMKMDFEKEDINIDVEDAINVFQGLWLTGNTQKIKELDKGVISRVIR